MKLLPETDLFLLESRKCRNKPVLAKTVMVVVILPLILVNVPIFVQEFVDGGFQPHSVPFSVSGNSNVLLCDFEGYLSELHTKLSPISQRTYSFSITKTIWLRLLMEMKEIRCNNDAKSVNIV